MTKIHHIGILCTAIALLAAGGRDMRDMVVPMHVQYPLFLKILTFDRELTTRAGDELVIGIVYQDLVRPSWLAKDELMRAIEASPVKRIKNLEVRAVAIAVDESDRHGRQSANATRLEDAVDAHDVDILYVSPMRAYDLDRITRLARSRRLLTLTGVPAYVEAGLAIGIGLRRDSPVILVNLPAARESGADLHASLLRLATLIED